MVEINNLDQLFQAIGKYNVPTVVVLDVNSRIRDWLASGGEENDQYVINQCKYVEKIINNKLGGI